MSNKKPSNARCKAKVKLNKKTVKGAMENKGKQYKRYRKGPVIVKVMDK